MKTNSWRAMLASAILFPAAAFSQQVTGTLGYNVSPNENLTITFTCMGIPTCVGTFNLVERAPQCTNLIVETNSFSITGLNLAQTGTITGIIVAGKADNHYVRAADGTCSVAPGATDAVLQYSGTWNLPGKVGTFTVVSDHVLTGAFTADVSTPAPVFPLTVQSSINAQTATASATLRPRAEDVGRAASVFVFASAPASRVQGALAAKVVKLGLSTGGPKAEPEQCVLAQVTPQGSLSAVTTAQLSAIFTGTLSAAGTGVNILNNTPTPNVAGATFYVGYGGTGQAMIDEGVFRNAVLVPGNTVCPMLPYTTALWLHPAEAGWGLNVIQQGSVAFATLFTYDANRQPLWLLMSGGQLQPDGLTFTGDLLRTTGPGFSSTPFTPIGSANYSRVGTMTMTMTHANAAQLRYTVNGAEVTKSIQRYVFGSHAANCMPTSDNRSTSTNYTDLWWKADESGWGLNITHQDDILFGTLFSYASGAGSSNPGLWLVMSEGRRQGDGSYLGNLYRTTGPAFNAVPFTPIGAADQTVVGTMRLRFTDGNNGTLNYTVNGVNVEKAITRIPFATPVAACN